MEKYQATPTDNKPESLSAARAIVDGTGMTPVMAVVDAMLVLCKEIANISNFLAQNIRHTSYELFQEELDRCYQDSEKIVGERLSKFLCEHSEAEELNHSLIKMTIQIFITSFCAFVWDRYLDTPLHVEADKNASKGQRKAALLRNLISVFKIAAWVIPGSANRSAFEESLDPFFESVEEIEAAWTTVPEFAKISLSFVSPGEDLADFQTYAEAEVLPRIQTSIELSPS
ncbi:hypothetical protein M413DRAFT_31458 [Hebeloma cylindrosporum]|uniref:Uncharacterized protein n=1 Tax=Hebeloma cylindrosporum TaxID=76867 RepID=A0A0C2XG11_HEBCY|nr:hypothetical protein M413DRAFT_31458 [Hebeloma cylindrosporum h7]